MGGEWGGGAGGGVVICCSVILTDLTSGAVIMHCLEGEACMTVEKTDGILRNDRQKHRQYQLKAS